MSGYALGQISFAEGLIGNTIEPLYHKGYNPAQSIAIKMRGCDRF
jgi:hypothetical protein